MPERTTNEHKLSEGCAKFFVNFRWSAQSSQKALRVNGPGLVFGSEKVSVQFSTLFVVILTILGIFLRPFLYSDKEKNVFLDLMLRAGSKSNLLKKNFSLNWCLVFTTSFEVLLNMTQSHLMDFQYRWPTSSTPLSPKRSLERVLTSTWKLPMPKPRKVSD